MKKMTMPVLMQIIAALLVHVSCSDLAPSKYSTFNSYDWRLSTPEEQGMNPGMLSRAYDEVRQMPYYYSMLIVRNGYLVSEEYYNGRDEDNRDDLRSVTKSYTSALIGIAIEKGYIESVDSKLLDFFPDYVDEDTDPRKFEITIRHLLTMRSGFESEGNIAWGTSLSPNMIAAIISTELRFDPDTDFLYSTHGAHLLSGIITRATGMSTFAFADKYLFSPMGCKSVLWVRDQNDIFTGGSGMYLTPRDMARFGYLYMKKGVLNGKEIVPSEWIEQSFVNYRGGTEGWNEMDDVGYGYLWWTGSLNGHPIFFAMGYGGQWILIVPDLEIVIVTTMNPESERNWKQTESLITIASEYILPAVRD